MFGVSVWDFAQLLKNSDITWVWIEGFDEDLHAGLTREVRV